MKNKNINFYLPDFYYFYRLNVKIIELLHDKAEVFYDGINIKSLYGSFPGAYWNGGRVMHGMTDKNNIENTIAGINDKAFCKYALTQGKTVLDFFHPDAKIPKEHTDKNTSTYIFLDDFKYYEYIYSKKIKINSIILYEIILIYTN